MWETIAPHIPTIIGLILAGIFGFAVKKKWLKEDLAKKIELDVSGAVTSVYHEYVKARKAANEDGKLTEEEKKEARKLALDKLKEVGKEKGIDYAKEYGLPAILGLVEKYVTKNKSETKEE